MSAFRDNDVDEDADKTPNTTRNHLLYRASLIDTDADGYKRAYIVGLTYNMFIARQLYTPYYSESCP